MQAAPITSLPTAQAASPLIDVKTAAGILGVCTRTVVRMCERGEIKAVRVRSLWRINRAALMEFIGEGECACN